MNDLTVSSSTLSHRRDTLQVSNDSSKEHSAPPPKPRPKFLADSPQTTALVAFLLGILFSTGSFMIFQGSWAPHGWRESLTSCRLGGLIVTWSTFHMLEYIVTAIYNPTRVSVSSFLIDNGASYHIAHLFGMLEFCLEQTLLPPSWKSFKDLPVIAITGGILIVVGQCLRSLAMITAAQSFTHIISERKQDDHTLVTWGIYSYFRHPSYAGFLYWAIGTQLWLGNPVASVGFAIILWRFFSSRIQGEEAILKRFFGDKYAVFCKQTGTKIPFIP